MNYFCVNDSPLSFQLKTNKQLDQEYGKIIDNQNLNQTLDKSNNKKKNDQKQKIQAKISRLKQNDKLSSSNDYWSQPKTNFIEQKNSMDEHSNLLSKRASNFKQKNLQVFETPSKIFSSDKRGKSSQILPRSFKTIKLTKLHRQASLTLKFDEKLFENIQKVDGLQTNERMKKILTKQNSSQLKQEKDQNEIQMQESNHMQSELNQKILEKKNQRKKIQKNFDRKMKEYEFNLEKNEGDFQDNAIPYQSYVDKMIQIQGKQKQIRDEYEKQFKPRFSQREKGNLMMKTNQNPNFQAEEKNQDLNTLILQKNPSLSSKFDLQNLNALKYKKEQSAKRQSIKGSQQLDNSPQAERRSQARRHTVIRMSAKFSKKQDLSNMHSTSPISNNSDDSAAQKKKDERLKAKKEKSIADRKKIQEEMQKRKQDKAAINIEDQEKKKISKFTNKVNSFLEQFNNNWNSTFETSFQKEKDQTLAKHRLIIATPSDVKNTQSQIPQFMSSQKLSANQTFTTFESMMKTLAQKQDKQSVLKMLDLPQVQSLPNYTSHALKILKTEIQTMKFMLQNMLDSKFQIKQLLAPQQGTNEKIANQVECLPMMSQYLKVIFKNRIAPLVLKFEYYDVHTNEQIKYSDVLVCWSTTNNKPSVAEKDKYQKSPSHIEFLVNSNGLNNKTEKNSHHIQGRVFPEFEADGKTRLPQQLYVSLTSQNGFDVLVYVAFPEEKNHVFQKSKLILSKKDQKNRIDSALSFSSDQKQVNREEQRIKNISNHSIYSATHTKGQEYIRSEVNKTWENQYYTPPQKLDEFRLQLEQKRRQNSQVTEPKLFEDSGFTYKHDMSLKKLKSQLFHVQKQRELFKSSFGNLRHNSGKNTLCKQTIDDRIKTARDKRKLLFEQSHRHKVYLSMKPQITELMQKRRQRDYEIQQRQQKFFTGWFKLQTMALIAKKMLQKQQNLIKKEQKRIKEDFANKIIIKHARRYFKQGLGLTLQQRLVYNSQHASTFLTVLTKRKDEQQATEMIRAYLQKHQQYQLFKNKTVTLFEAQRKISEAWKARKLKINSVKATIGLLVNSVITKIKKEVIRPKKGLKKVPVDHPFIKSIMDFNFLLMDQSIDNLVKFLFNVNDIKNVSWIQLRQKNELRDFIASQSPGNEENFLITKNDDVNKLQQNHSQKKINQSIALIPKQLESRTNSLKRSENNKRHLSTITLISGQFYSSRSSQNNQSSNERLSSLEVAKSDNQIMLEILNQKNKIEERDMFIKELKKRREKQIAIMTDFTNDKDSSYFVTALDGLLNFKDLEKEQARQNKSQVKRPEKAIIQWRMEQIQSVQKAFKQHERKKEEIFQDVMRNSYKFKKSIPQHPIIADKEEIVMCVLKVIFDSMNGKKSVYTN